MRRDIDEDAEPGVDVVPPRPLRALVAALGGELDDAVSLDVVVAKAGPSDARGEPDLAPVLDARSATRLRAEAHVLLVDASVADRVAVGRRWVHAHARWALAELLAVEEPLPIDDAAMLAPGEAPRGVRIEPGARVVRGAVVGEGSFVACGAVVYARVRLGRGVYVGPNSVVGHAGFGFVDAPSGVSPGGPVRFPHRAGVLLDDDVELGAMCTVDAGVLSATRIGPRTKLDAHVHVGHGVVVGARCRIAAQVGLAGSVVVGDDVYIGGQAGVADHVHIGRGARVAAKAGVIGDIDEGAIVAGYPAVARVRWLRGLARLYRRP